MNLITDFLDGRKQRVVLNCQYSWWASLKLGHPQGSIKNISKTIGLLTKLQKILAISPLLTIHKSFIGLHLDYGDIRYNKAYNKAKKNFT